MKRIIYALIMVPVALAVAYWIGNFGADVVNGNFDVLAFLSNHKVIIAFVVCYVGLQFIGPFKK